MEKFSVFIIIGIAVMPIILLDIWAVLDISKFPSKQRREKWLWTNIVLILPYLGVFVYIFYGRNSLRNSSFKNIV